MPIGGGEGIRSRGHYVANVSELGLGPLGTIDGGIDEFPLPPCMDRLVTDPEIDGYRRNQTGGRPAIRNPGRFGLA